MAMGSQMLDPKVLQGISQGKFVVVGRVGMDFFTHPGEKAEDASTMLTGMGGSSANIAAGLVKLGCDAALVTCISDDAVGHYCLSQLNHYGVNTDHVRTIIGEERTSLAVYESRLDDHRTVIYRNNAADFRMDIGDVEGIDYSTFSALITAGTAFAAEPSRTAAFRAFELAKNEGLPIIFDATHSVQQPGGQGTTSGGQREMVPTLSRAAVAVGVAGIFAETHQDPANAPSDGPNMIPLDHLETYLSELRDLDRIAKARQNLHFFSP